jgi:outer membrane lipase/esterase
MLASLRRTLGIVSVAAAAVMSAPVHAGPYSSMVVFSDSLSDTGNVRSLTTAVFGPGAAFPVYPGAEGRFSNGPVWVETLAAGLGLAADAAPSNLIFNGATVSAIGVPGGQNYAYGGARTGLGGSAGPTTGLLGQLIAWNGSVFDPTSGLTRAADSAALYVVTAGGNDMRDFRSGASGALSPVAAATNIANSVALLAQAGARNFLIGNLPDLGKTPEAAALGLQLESTAATQAFNLALAAALGSFEAAFLGLTGIDLNLHLLDLYGLNEVVYADATSNGGAIYGITNVSTPCLSRGAISGQYFAPDATASNCASSSFSDDLHPSAAAHAILGLAALRAVPEPAAIWLAIFALGALTLTRRRRA